MLQMDLIRLILDLAIHPQVFSTDYRVPCAAKMDLIDRTIRLLLLAGFSD